MLFAKVTYEHPRSQRLLEYGWMLKLTTASDVLDYFSSLETTAHNAMEDISKMVSGKGHYAHEVSYAIAVQAERLHISPVRALGKLLGDKMTTMMSALPVYVNQAGGWFHQSDDTKELDTMESDWWPEHTKPKFQQWPGGKHWYCSVDGRNIEVAGKQKWNTYEAAVAAYRLWQNSSELSDHSRCGPT